jgi:RNA polymerase sigma-70 factor (ECF subfamily)
MAGDGDAPSVFDEARWAAIVRAHAPFLRRAIGRLVGFGEHVDDVVQEAFVSAFRRAHDLPHDDLLLRAWLFRAAKHHLQHDQRRHARVLRKVAALSAVAPSSSSPVVLNEQQQAAQQVRAATLRLPEAQRDVFVLVELEGLSVVAAATVLDVNENTLRSRLQAARTAFAAAIKEAP